MCHCEGGRPMLFTTTGLRRAGHVVLARAKPISSATGVHPRGEEAFLKTGEARAIYHCSLSLSWLSIVAKGKSPCCLLLLPTSEPRRYR